MTTGLLPSIYARYTDNILADAVITATVAPMASYDLATLGLQRPETRVRFEDTTLTITFTLASPAQGDVFALPVSNLDAGSPTVLTLTNGNGLSQQVSIPVMPINGIPLTVVVDLTILTPSDATRTDDVWNLVIVGNSIDVILGGAVFVYGPKRTLEPADLQWEFSESIRAAASETPNEYLTRYRQSYETQERILDARVRCHYDQKEDLKSFYLANAGLVQPGLLWPEPTINDAYIGTWPEVFAAQQVGEFTDYYDVTMQFRELSKGKPV